MKLDLFKRQWVDIVFEGRNQSYGAYELRTTNNKTTYRALVIGSLFFILAVSAPLIISLIPDSTEEVNNDIKITTVKLPPKKEKPRDPTLPPPPPPAPKVDQVKFVKPVVAKADEITEEPPKVTDLKDKNIGAETIKGNPDAELTVEPVGTGTAAVVEEDNTVYNSAGLEVQPEFPGGIKKFYSFIGNTFVAPDDAPSGKVYVTFTVEKDGSLTDIKVTRDVGFGSKEEALRTMKKCPKWAPGEQNGKKVRATYSVPIVIQAQE